MAPLERDSGTATARYAGHALAALPVAFVMVAEMVVIVKRAEDASNASSASEAREAKIARWRRPSKGEILRGSLSGTMKVIQHYHFCQINIHDTVNKLAVLGTI